MGEGNRANLELLNAAVLAGKKVFSMRTPKEGQKLWEIIQNQWYIVKACQTLPDSYPTKII